MFKTFLAIALVLLLAACAPTDEQKAHVRSMLPAGCQVIDLGKYGEIDRLVMVQCDGRSTTSTYSFDRRQSGKSTITYEGLVLKIGAL